MQGSDFIQKQKRKNMAKQNDSNSSGFPILNWFESPIKQSIQSVFDGINEAVEAKDIFNKYKKAQFQTLKRTMSHIKILGMSTPIKLRDIYYPTQISTTIHRRLYERNWHKYDESDELCTQSIINTTTTVRADDFIEAHNHLVVLGGPGFGKTTLLRFLAYAYCDKTTFQTSNLKTSKFPIFIHLPELSKTDTDIEQFAYDLLIKKTDQYAKPFLRNLFISGNAIILLDSLDEVPSESKSSTLDAIRNFYETYPLCSIIVSCRTADYVEIVEDFYEVEITRLSEDAVPVIVKAWFGKEGASNAKKLLVHLKNDSAIASLTENPLLLSLLCIQFKHDLSLPKRKAELYRRCIDALLRDWDASRGFRRKTVYENLSDDRKERIFNFIAYHFYQHSPKYVFPEKSVIKKIGQYIERFDIEPKKAKSILTEMESHHGILEKVSMGLYSFSHPSFQEYFTAKAILSRREDLNILKKHYENEDWSGVIEFIVALREDPEELIKYMLNKSTVGNLKTYPAMARRTMNLWLLYKCLASGPSISPNLYEECCSHIVSSQFNMANIYRKGGVVPFAVLMADGVRHSYYYWKKRPTLYNALQPLRSLANIIYSMPVPRYATKALTTSEELVENNGPFFEVTSLALSLVIPLASVAAKEVKRILDKLKTRAIAEKKEKYFVAPIDESLNYLEKRISE